MKNKLKTILSKVGLVLTMIAGGIIMLYWVLVALSILFLILWGLYAVYMGG